ncbi:hypothetical protein K2173_015868 [Erythroxylum novogranatense]|uniref:Nucleoside phosphorylase domain-containing protein n=1 Tax=Erythroxylum novogranatense TaxID=1862640 RepID=A0AAV8SEN9_9ROSI|nr:hypothetical protein K2173_015868 [Erythroxylum novogranatense]
MKRLCRMEMVALAVLLVVIGSNRVNGLVSEDTMKKIKSINDEGPHLGIIVPNAFEMKPLLESPSFVANHSFPYIDVSGKRFRMGKVGEAKVIIVLTGLSMLNAGITTQLLLSLFRVNGIVHHGIAGNANPQLQIGDVTIPQYWAHSGLWNWQRNGDGPNDTLALESNGDYTRSIGYLRFANYNNYTANSKPVDNILNNVWYQPEEIFPVNGIPEVRQHAFWVPVDHHYFQVAKKLENLELKRCINSTCLPRKPVVTRVSRGVSANVFVDNRAYREFLYSKFNTTPIDMESAAIALVCHQQQMPFITIRALSDLAGGGSALSNEADTFASLAAQNAVDALVGFVALLFP